MVPQARAERVVDEIRSIHGGFGNTAALLEAFRESVLLVPLTTDDRFFTSEVDGIEWLSAFTDHDALTAFLARRPDASDRCAAVTGDRILTRILAANTGIVIDAVSDFPMALTPDMLTVEER